VTPPRWDAALEAFAVFERARDRQDARAMVASLAALAPILGAGADAARAAAGALSIKHERFVAEYLIDLNATAAYRRTYGAQVKGADASGPRLLAIPSIAQAIATGKARQMAGAELSASRVLEELRRVAFSNVRDYFDIDGSAKHPSALTTEQGAALAGFEVLIKNAKAGDGVTDTIHKFKLWDKVRGLELLAKHYALLVEKIEIKDVGAEARIARLIAARKRVGK
jgi:phage terminase small subunit